MVSKKTNIIVGIIAIIVAIFIQRLILIGVVPFLLVVSYLYSKDGWKKGFFVSIVMAIVYFVIYLVFQFNGLVLYSGVIGLVVMVVVLAISSYLFAKLRAKNAINKKQVLVNVK